MSHYCPNSSKPKSRQGKTGDSGFSVLEAMIAMAILAAALLPLLALQGQFVRTVDSLERAEQRMSARDTALNYLQSLNLNLIRTGELSLNEAQMSWESQPVMPHRPVRSLTGFPGRFDLTLYDVRVTLTFQTGHVDIFTFRGLGWAPRQSLTDGI